MVFQINYRIIFLFKNFFKKTYILFCFVKEKAQKSQKYNTNHKKTDKFSKFLVLD